MTVLPLALLLAAADPREVAERWAPVFHQDVADGLSNDAAMRRLDLLTAVEFDGTLDPFDNVEDARSGAFPMPGAVYWDVVETETHLYVLYSLFHPVDWNEFDQVDHENDMEHVWVVVRKHAGGTEELQVLHTQAHGQLMAWSDGGVTGDGYALSDGGLDLEDGHPRVFIEAHGHGPYSCTYPGGLPATGAVDCDPADDDDMVIYRVEPGAVPGDLAEPDVSADAPTDAPYALVSARETLWPYRHHLAAGGADPPMWDSEFTYEPARNADDDFRNDLPIDPALLPLGGEFAGDEDGGGGVPPWGYVPHDSWAGGTYYAAQGDMLLDPAMLFDALYDDACTAQDAFWNYLSNPYLDEVADPAGTLPHDGIDQGRRCDGVQEGEDTGDSGTPGDTATGGDTSESEEEEGAAAVRTGGRFCGCGSDGRDGALVIGLVTAMVGRRRSGLGARLGSTA